MKKWQKWLLGIVGALAMLLAVAAARWWPTIAILKGTEGLSGSQKAAPREGAATLPPLTQGEADWVCWRGAKDDGRSTVTGIRTDWSGGLKRLWEVDFLCQGSDAAAWSAPVVRGNRLVVCGRDQDKDMIFCLGPADGRLLWQASYAAKAKASHGAGPRATPYIDGDRVYTFGRNGALACWGLLDGRGLWRRNVHDAGGKEPRWGHSSSPLVVGKLVIVQGGRAAQVIAYDKLTGDVAWKCSGDRPGYAALTTMALGDTLAILAFHGKGLAALAADSGAKLWDTPWPTPFEVNATTPVVAGDTVFITSGYGTGGALLRASKTDAKTVWSNDAIASHHSDPYIIDGFLYGYSGQSFQNRGDFKCVDLQTGDETWATDEVGWGTCVLVDGHLLCCDILGNLFLVKPRPDAFTKVAEWPDALGKTRGPVWTIPVIANGRLYLRFKQRLVCYELAQG